MVFNPDSSAYKTCCCHVRTCTLVIGILELIAIVAQFLINVISNAIDARADTGTVVGVSIALAVIMFLAGLVVVILLFVGLRKQNEKFLIPHLVFQVIAMVIVGIYIVFFVIAMIAGSVVVATSKSSVTHDDDNNGVRVHVTGQEESTAVTGSAILIIGTIGIIVCALAIALEIWFFVVVLRCYRFFRDQRQAGFTGNVQLAPVVVQQQYYPQVQQQQQYDPPK